jgi:hypothetical protein
MCLALEDKDLNVGNHSPNGIACYSKDLNPRSFTVLETTESLNICECVKNLIVLKSGFIH